MKAQDLQFTQLLSGAKQFIIPIFQRTYSWEVSHCEQLWNDILRVGSLKELDSHFVGSVVYIPEQETSAAISRWLVIDGQQRITTITLLFLALMQHLQEKGQETPISAAELEDYYLKNRYGKGEEVHKVLLTETDKKTLIALLEGKSLPENASRRIVENFKFFKKKLANADLKTVFEGIRKLKIVDVSLQQGIDDPQMIFESMNSTGMALTQADLIRNYVLMGLDHRKQTRLYTEYWRPMEKLFGIDNYGRHFDEFARFFLQVQTRKQRILKRDVYSEFKVFAHERDVEEMLRVLVRFAQYYCHMALGRKKDPDLDQAFHDIRELRADVCYPMLMEVYSDYEDELITKSEFIEIIRIVESYVFRRAACDIPTHSLSLTFSTFCRGLKKDRYVESARATFLLLPTYRRFPSDSEFIRALKSRDLYNFQRQSYWLRRFENFERKERVAVNDYTIEHIMPQNENLNRDWREALGEDWQRVHDQYLHTLGNLTLTGYNSEYSDRSFAQKRDMKGGFAESPLKLNEGLGQCETWNEAQIKARAERLAERAKRIWKGLSLPEDIIEMYQVKDDVTRSEYTLEDHPNLLVEPVRSLFESIRKEILHLSPSVHEEFLKLYAAYKADRNFVDIVPRSKRLRLSLNMAFPDIDDPRGICRDITGVGRWGNGDVEFMLENEDEIPYALGLIRQALALQIGDPALED